MAFDMGVPASTARVTIKEVNREKDMMKDTSLSKDDVIRPMSVDNIPLLNDAQTSSSTGVQGRPVNNTRGRRID